MASPSDLHDVDAKKRPTEPILDVECAADSSDDEFDMKAPTHTPESAKKAKHGSSSRPTASLVRDFGVLFTTRYDNDFGPVASNSKLYGQKCVVMTNLTNSVGIPLKNMELNENQPFVPFADPTFKYTVVVKAVNMYNHDLQDDFPKSTLGCTIAVPALAYSSTLLRHFKLAFGTRVTINISEHDVHSTVHYTKKVKGIATHYFIKSLEAIHWLRETLEANGLVYIVPPKNALGCHALHLTQDRFDAFASICKDLNVRLALLQ